MKQKQFLLILKAQLNTKGSTLVEVLLSGAMLVILVTALTGMLIYGRESTLLAGQRARAAFLAEEGLEAVRAIRNSNYASLTNGEKGLSATAGAWYFNGTSDDTDIFNRKITITDAAVDRKQIVSTVTWQANAQRNGTVSAITYLTNWQNNADATPAPNSCATYCQSLGSYSAGTCRQNTNQCTSNSETYQSGGDLYCTGGASADTCCCRP